MAPSRKCVLIAGLGRFVSAVPEAAAKFGPQNINKQMVLDVCWLQCCLEQLMHSLTWIQDIEKARIAGYDCASVDVDPDNPEESVRQIRERLQSQHWDLFIIGFGVRGNKVPSPTSVMTLTCPNISCKTFTALFEDAVNACVELSPTTKFGFSPAPDAVYQTILRVLPQA